ncbi:MAG: alpha-L-rhamnosidase C-terminal domain-containing protein [bacterium]|nr:alpha-L-rhamnosidase C-terminal domain-containing protein [bacterium]
MRQYITPQRVVWFSNDETAVVENPESLLEMWSGQVTLDAHDPCVLRTQGKPAGILLDFGKELQGGVQIMGWHSKGNKPVRLRVRFGESVSEAMSDLGGEKNATNDHAIRDQECLLPWLGVTEIGNTGFRFVRIDLLDEDSFVQLKNVRAIFIYRDLEYKGTFRCNDERLNQIWDTGAYTVHLNMQDYLWDGIKRDRLVWIGDMHPETMTIFSVFGAQDIIPASLDLIRDETPLPKWMNGISSYSMWWVLIHHEWYLYNGDVDYLQDQKAYMTGLLQMLAEQVGPDNRETMPEGRFLDWPSNANPKAIHAGLQSLLIMTLEAGATICDVLEEPDLKATCLASVEKLRHHVPDPNGSKQAAALMALAGLADAQAMNQNVMAVDGAQRMSTFYGYYVLQARAKAGDYQGALDAIRTYWGAMLDLGATTFWEDFDLNWTVNAGRIDELVPEGKKDVHGDYGNYCYLGFRHSLCHGWASGPTAWLTEHVLGVKVTAPGCKAITIQPNLGDLQWVEGTYPTPYGLIYLKHVKAADGSIQSEINAPDEIQITRN